MLEWLLIAAVVALTVTVITMSKIIKELKQMLKKYKLRDGEAKIKKIYRNGDYNQVDIGLYSGKRFLIFPKKVGKLSIKGDRLEPGLHKGQKIAVCT